MGAAMRHLKPGGAVQAVQFTEFGHWSPWWAGGVGALIGIACWFLFEQQQGLRAAVVQPAPGAQTTLSAATGAVNSPGADDQATQAGAPARTIAGATTAEAAQAEMTKFQADFIAAQQAAVEAALARDAAVPSIKAKLDVVAHIQADMRLAHCREVKKSVRFTDEQVTELKNTPALGFTTLFESAWARGFGRGHITPVIASAALAAASQNKTTRQRADLMAAQAAAVEAALAIGATDTSIKVKLDRLAGITVDLQLAQYTATREAITFTVEEITQMRSSPAAGFITLFGVASSAAPSSPPSSPQPAQRNPAVDDPGWEDGSPFGRVRPMRSRLALAYGLNRESVPREARVAVVRAFPSLYPYEQAMLLRDPLWSHVSCAEFIPVLEPLLKVPDAPERESSTTYLDLVIQRLNELGSAAARRFVIDDLKRSKPMLSLSGLLCLPPEELTELDADFSRDLANLSASDAWKVLPAIARYGSANLLPEVRTLCLDSEGRGPCAGQTACLQYWIKHDPEWGIKALVRVVNKRGETGCFRTAISDVTREVYSPELEAAILPFLGDTNIDVVMDAAVTIGRRGTKSGRDRIIQLIQQYSPDSVVKAAIGAGEWRPRMDLIASLSYSRRPLPNESELAPLKLILTSKEWDTMLERLGDVRSLQADP